MNSFEIIYDFNAGDAVPKFAVLLFPIGFYLFSRFILFIREDSTQNFQNQKVTAIIIKYFSLILFLLLFIILNVRYDKTNNLYKNSKLTTEGFVTNFHPMPSGGHDTERFTVNGIFFKFSDFDISNFGYNNTKSHGGAIDENKYVKISYIRVKNSNQILKLEVRK